MPKLTLTIQDRSGVVRACASGDGEVWLVYEPSYIQGDTILVISDQPDQFLVLCLDDALAPAFVYCAGTACTYPIPFGEARKVFSGRAFEGTRHYLHVRMAKPEEIAARKNLALNPWAIHPDVLETCQLSMGLTQLAPGSVWNTMPAHTHERRMEVYTYFEIPEDQVVFHMMGQPGETRHLVMQNFDAVISPSWSIHSGCGTANYTFIWAMGGENQAFDDMDNLKPTNLK